MEEYKTVGIKVSTYNKLSNLGRFGESFDELINRLIEEREKLLIQVKEKGVKNND